MGNINKFYISKLGTTTDLFFGYSWSSGSFESTSDMKVGATSAIEVKSYSRFIHEVTISGCTSVKIYDIDEEKKVIRSRMNPGAKIDIPIKSDVYYIAIELSFNSEHSRWVSIDYEILRLVNPYYKSIKNQYKKESGQMFFRESINGTIELRGLDYEYINSISIEDNIGFYIYRGESVYALNEFNKSDCKVNHSLRSIELKLNPKDNYSKVLGGYEKTYDLIKLPISKSSVELTKRSVMQLYFQGENTITNYAGGTYWEDEVNEAVNDANALRTKYYFSEGPSFREINLSGFNYNINAVFKLIDGQQIINGTQFSIVNGQRYEYKSSIVFTKIYSKGQTLGNDEGGTYIRPLKLSDDVSQAYLIGGADTENPNGSYSIMTYDTYRIEVYYGGHDGTGRKIYQSEKLYGNDSNFKLAQGTKYKMVKVSQSVPYEEPSPDSFYLGEKITIRSLWGRLLCDVDVDADGVSTYAVPSDDFAIDIANFRRCVGLKYSSDGNSFVHFVQSSTTQDEVTPFGVAGDGRYFVAPNIRGSFQYYVYPYPFGRSGWGNTSLWVGFEEPENTAMPGIEKFLSKFYKKIYHKDCMEIGTVIKAVLNKIDSSIKFDSTVEYSEFLYGSTANTPGYRRERIYITQKSNVLKGEYDQAAKKAEITFAQLMNMLRNCFRCYWYIDKDRRFRIEHVRYFMNGLSYTSPEKQYNLTEKYDKFTKKQVLYGQDEISYSKSELKSRYEFAWADDSTHMMGGGFSVDVNSNYIDKGNIESVNIDLFSPDIDFMMFAPERFSQDGFALIITDKDNKVPILYAKAYDEINPTVEITSYVQNYDASFLNLFDNYLYDMPSDYISSSVEIDNDQRYYVKGKKKFIQQSVRFQPGTDPDMYKLIGTEQGDGSIEDLSVDIDTGVVEATLLFNP